MPRSIKMSGLPSDGRKPGDGQGQLFILLGATMQVQRVPHRVPLFSRNSSVHTTPDNAPFLFISFSLPLSLSRFDSIRLGIPRGGRDQLVGRGEEGRRQCRKISPPSLKVESFTSSRRNPTFGRENEKGEPSGGGEGRGGGGRVRCLYSKVKSTVRYATKQVWPLGIY